MSVFDCCTNWDTCVGWVPLGCDSFALGLVQFWYTDETARLVSEELSEAAGAQGQVACIACPSLFRMLLNEFPGVPCHLLEYDTRFESLGSFVHYDYAKPLALPDELKGAFDVVVADPPYLVSG